MKTFISIGDLVDIYFKIQILGLNRILARLAWVNKARITKAWNNANNSGQTHWWSVPLVRKRWNSLITGDLNTEYPDYLIKKYLHNRFNLNLLSPGCGTGNKELKFANFNNFQFIDAFDIAPNRIKVAKENAKQLGYKNIQYTISDVFKFNFGNKNYDVVLFDSFLHHIKKLDEILDKIYYSLKPDGIFVINEYVGPNRFQWSKEQLKLSNKALGSLPPLFRKRWQSESKKSKIYRPGLLRMILSDPSEAVNSENILPKIKKRFKILEENPYGGNILQLTLKDISHNFIGESKEGIQLMNALFKIEDDFLNNGNKSDFIFGIYSK